MLIYPFKHLRYSMITIYNTFANHPINFKLIKSFRDYPVDARY